MIYIGIDPGLDGGIAAIMQNGVILQRMPTRKLLKKREVDEYQLVRDLKELVIANCMIGIEIVHAMPGQGVTSMFNFGRSYGVIQGVVASMGVPVIYVTPQAWKKVMLAGTDKSKGAAIATAQRMYPTLEKELRHDGVAEALLIASWLGK